MVVSADMGLLMGNDIGNVFCIHPGRQIDHRANQTQHKWRIHKLAPLDVFFDRNRSRYPMFQKQIAYQNVREHNSKTNDPDSGKNGNPCLCRAAVRRRIHWPFQHHISAGIKDLSFALRNRSHTFLQNNVSRRIEDLSSALYF